MSISASERLKILVSLCLAIRQALLFADETPMRYNVAVVFLQNGNENTNALLQRVKRRTPVGHAQLGITRRTVTGLCM